jgi:hypothetical protein
LLLGQTALLAGQTDAFSNRLRIAHPLNISQAV